ncbi:MAG: hypothetical protein WC996_10390 [Peptostreptococcales bacterium]
MSHTKKVLPLVLPVTIALTSNPKLLKKTTHFVSSVLDPKKMNVYAQRSDQIMHKFSNTVDKMKKINHLTEIKGLSGNQADKDYKIQEAFSTLKEISPDNYYKKLDSLENTYNVIQKISKTKKILDIQKSLTGAGSSLQSPLALLNSAPDSDESDKNNNFEKILKLATLFSNLTKDSKG